MKKRNLLIILILGLILVLGACGSKEKSPDPMGGSHETIVLPPFNLTSTKGGEISSDIFADNDINILALWQST